jgi:hypothetical protein
LFRKIVGNQIIPVFISLKRDIREFVTGLALCQGLEKRAICILAGFDEDMPSWLKKIINFRRPQTSPRPQVNDV